MIMVLRNLAILIFSTAQVIHAAAPPEPLLTPPPANGPAVVKVSFELQGINGIDDEAETFEFNGLLRLTWKDPRQAFTPAEAGVPEKIYQGAYQFEEISPAWYPQLFLANESGLFETDAVTLWIRPDGTNVLSYSVNAIAESHLSMRRYPFDNQTLKAVFTTPGIRTDEVTFESETAACASGMQVSQWNIEGVEITTEAMSGSPAFVVNVAAMRDPMFTLRLVALPLALIVMLSWSVFWMERSSLGDRISISFVGILTAVAYQIVVGDLLPHVSYITLMHAFLNLSFFVMCATVVINLVVGACDKRGKHELGDVIDHWCRWLFPIGYLSLLVVIGFVAFRVLS